MDKRLSVKISLVSFFLLLYVVFAHSYNISFEENADNYVWFIQNWISFGLSDIIIPIFFFISGYLFFLSFDINKNLDWNAFKTKITKRMHTLGKPYLFWCIFWFAFVYILQLIPALQPFFPNPLYDMSLAEQFWNMLLEPINYPFWFIRELLLYVLITPFIYLTVKYLKFYVIIALFIAALFDTSIVTLFEVDMYKYYMMAYFIFGAYCAMYKVSLKTNMNKYLIYFLILIWIVSSAIAKYFELYYQEAWAIRLLADLSALIGCIAMWGLYDLMDKTRQFKFHDIFTYGFFIYATHGVPILFLKKIFDAFFDLTDYQLLLLYLVNFVITAAICLVFGYYLKKIAPRFYFFSTGNR
nr:acyltransferase family protein [Allomuricauda sp.]